MSTIDLKVSAKEANKLISDIRDKAQDMTPFMRVFAGMLGGFVRENFEAEGRPTAWEPLKPATVKERGGAHPILNRRGSYGLIGSLNEDYTDSTASVSTNEPHAAAHHFGVTITRYPHSREQSFRTRTRGPLKGLTLFSKAGAKGAFKKRVTVQKAYDITLPARPFMMVTDGDIGKVVAEARRILTAL